MTDVQAAGTRDKPVTLQALTDAVGSSGFPTESWADLATVYAHMKADTGGSEHFEDGHLSAPFMTTWQIPFLDAMDPDAIDVAKTRRLVHRGRTYDIVNGFNVGRRRTIALLTLARQG